VQETIRRGFMREEGHQAGNGAANKSRVAAGSGSTSVGVALRKVVLKRPGWCACRSF